MGLCASGPANADPAERDRNKVIEKIGEQDHAKEAAVQKLLLLGAGESGKSTLFKQVVDLYGSGISKEEYVEFIPTVHSNTITAMQTLITQSDLLQEEKGNTRIAADLETEKKTIMELSPGATVDPNLAQMIKKLWADNGIQNTWALRSRFQLPVSADYFFNKVEEFAKEGWMPCKQDILQCRVRTTGIQETILTYEKFQLKLVDVGGQRNERKKWIRQFDGVNALIFVAAISEYDQMLFEDETVNRMYEALSIFEEISNADYFSRSSMILFLNKRDLFAEKITRVPLTVCFPDFPGPNEYEPAWKFIAEKFLSKRRDLGKDVYVQITCATDDTNVKFVFSAVRDIVIQRALQRSGLLA